MDEKLVKEILLKEFNYPDWQLDETYEKLNCMEPSIRVSFEQWLIDRRMPPAPVFQGFTPASIW